MVSHAASANLALAAFLSNAAAPRQPVLRVLQQTLLTSLTEDSALRKLPTTLLLRRTSGRSRTFVEAIVRWSPGREWRSESHVLELRLLEYVFQHPEVSISRVDAEDLDKRLHGLANDL